jgi:hypothetical protein
VIHLCTATICNNSFGRRNIPDWFHAMEGRNFYSSGKPWDVDDKHEWENSKKVLFLILSHSELLRYVRWFETDVLEPPFGQIISSWIYWPLNMEEVGSSETSLHTTLRRVITQKTEKIQFNRSGNLRSRKIFLIRCFHHMWHEHVELWSRVFSEKLTVFQLSRNTLPFMEL